MKYKIAVKALSILVSVLSLSNSSSALGRSVPVASATSAAKPSGFAAAKQRPPSPPATPPPNRTRSGGSLGDEKACVAGSPDLVALVPVENPVLTTETHPTLLFYVPYGADQVQYGEFSVLIGPNEMTRHVQTRFTLPAQPGIVSISLPASAESLQENTSYHWYVQLYCQGSTTADIQVDGWVQRVALTPERQQQIQAATPEIWYDASAQVAAQLAVTQTDTALQSRLQTQWRQLLQHIGAEALASEPVVGAVQWR